MNIRVLVSTLFVTIVLPVSWVLAAHSESSRGRLGRSVPRLESYIPIEDEPSPTEFSLYALSDRIAAQDRLIQKIRREVNKAHFDAVDAKRRCISLVLFCNSLQQHMDFLEFQAQLRELEYLGHIRRHVATVIPLEEALKSLRLDVRGMQASHNALEGRVALLEAERVTLGSSFTISPFEESDNEQGKEKE